MLMQYAVLRLSMHECRRCAVDIGIRDLILSCSLCPCARRGILHKGLDGV